MPKVVLNNCFGGFSLSEEAVVALAARKGLTLYLEKDRYDFTVYWTIPPEERGELIAIARNWDSLTVEQRKRHNELYLRHTFNVRPDDRTDPDLVAVVEQLGPLANGRCAELGIAEVPDDVSWHIEEYDGLEHIAEDHRTWDVRGER